jgi:hypothetical protein
MWSEDISAKFQLLGDENNEGIIARRTERKVGNWIMFIACGELEVYYMVDETKILVEFELY